MGVSRDRWWAVVLAVGGAPLAYLVLSHTLGRLFTLAITPAVAGIAVIAALSRPAAPWYGRTPTLLWLARGPMPLLAHACGPPLAVSLVATVAGSIALPFSTLPELFLYLAATTLLLAGATLLRGDAGHGVATGLTLLALLYGLPLAVLAVAELTPRPEQTIAAALSLWPPAVAAGLLHADVMRMAWCYSNLPVAYYPYAYPAGWLAAACLALPALFLLTFSWLRRAPPTGWSQPLWRPR